MVVCFLSSAIIGTINSPAQDSALRPEWRTNLRPALLSEPVRLIVGNRREPEARSQSSLWFMDSNTLVVTFVTRESRAKPGVSRRDDADESLPLRLQVILLDATTGQILKTASWPTESRSSRIVGVCKGKFVTLQGNELTLYASDLTVLKKASLPVSGILGWLAHPSPSGKSILFSSAELRKGSWVWVEADTLKVVRVWQDDPSGYLSISDQDMVTSTCWRGYECKKIVVTPNEASACFAGPKCVPSVEIKSLSSDWRTLTVGEPQLRPQFVSDDLIFLPGSSGRIIRTDGTVLFEQQRGRESWGCWGAGVVPSSKGNRFVIPSCPVKGAVARLDISGHVVLKQVFVFEIASTIRAQVLQVKGPEIKDQMEFALSPDGSKLAILNGEFVETMILPTQ